MRAPIGKLISAPVAGKPVFEDLSGLRVRRVKRWGKLAFVALLVWGIAITVAIVNPAKLAGRDAARQAGTESPAVVAPQSPGATDASLLIDVKAQTGAGPLQDPNLRAPAGRPVCSAETLPAGAAVAASDQMFPSRIYALLSNEPENAFLPLLRNCGRVDVILPEWFEINAPSLALTRTDLDAEMLEALRSIRMARGDATKLWPVFGFGRSLTAKGFLDGLTDKGQSAGLAKGIVRAAVGMKAEAACLRLRDLKPADADALMPFLTDLAAQAQGEGLKLCLVASLFDQLWASPALLAHFDKVIVAAYQEPWIGAQPQPLAPLDWFRAQVKVIKDRVPADKLVISVGGHAVDWVSGQAVPERISIAQAMFRISEASARIDFSPAARNSYASFFDRAGKRHQIWMLDAASVHNNLRVMRELGLSELAITSLGEEEPAYWDVLEGQLSSGRQSSFAAPEFPDNVVYSGEGAFYRLHSPSRAGLRLWRMDPDDDYVDDVRFDVVPRPAQMERYGTRLPRQIALTFDDGPDAVATARILDVLKAQKAPATFFVVGKMALSAPDLLKRALAEGHMIGSHSFSHPHLEDLSPFMLRAELSANRSLIEGVIGRTPMIFRPPYIRGPGPISEVEAMAFTVPAEEGYFVAGSDVVPTDWAGTSADGIVRQVFAELEKTGGNVIVLHDGRSAGMHTAEALELLIPALRARGYEIVGLPTLLGITTEAALPVVGTAESFFKSVSVQTISLWIALLTGIFWICIFASVLRSALYLFLSFRRDPVYPRNFAAQPSVTVIVPAYNEEKVIVATVQSVLASDYERLSCIVVDDGSTDATLAVLAKAFGKHPRVKVVSQPNQGKWQALNNAFRQVETEIAICVDADTRIAPDAIGEIVRPFADSKVAAVAGTVVVANATGLLTRFQSIEYITAQQIGRRAHEHLNGIMVVPGALGAWRVEAVRDVGLYSNETLTEDADLTIWLRRGGYRISYAENARAYTEAPTDVRSLLKQRLRWSFGNLQTLWKHRGAFLEFGPRRMMSMLDMVFFGYMLPLMSPILDILFLVFLAGLVSDWHSGRIADGVEVSHVAVFGVAFVQVMDLAVAWIAHRRERMPVWRLIYLIPLMNLFYRPLLYITVYRALWSALSGRLARWNKLRRLGLEPGRELTVR